MTSYRSDLGVQQADSSMWGRGSSDRWEIHGVDGTHVQAVERRVWEFLDRSKQQAKSTIRDVPVADTSSWICFI